ncbi:hypothetical protein [Sphingobium sp. YG1]|uniref:hypothetical protein n=1 Tax=Sphingobium sp. YG1 TaxID=2082188 RepID=UPI000DBAE740|nr:hypothetical protein [Sphingobium sp. YG1]BBC99126.1 hypothetical protein YGS_C1P0382 [Sphingobium sp. YG1]
MTAERADTGTRPLLGRGTYYRRAKQISQIANIIADITGPGVSADIHRADALIHKIAAICGQQEEDDQ